MLWVLTALRGNLYIKMALPANRLFYKRSLHFSYPVFKFFCT